MKKKFDTLNERDTYSLILFCLYKIKDLPEYSVLSHLVYVLDKENLLKLCEYFGGMTITIPTIDDLQLMLYALMLYQYVNIDKMKYDDAISQIGCKSNDLRAVKAMYTRIASILKDFSFSV